MEEVVKLPIIGVRQIKLPVTDLAVSARWYADLFDLELANEFFEAGAVRGVVLADHEAGFVIGRREHRAARRIRRNRVRFRAADQLRPAPTPLLARAEPA